MMAKSKLTRAETLKMAAAYVAAVEIGKSSYQKAGELLDLLVAGGQAGKPIALPDGRALTISDQFAGGKTKVWKSTPVSRYAAEVE